MMEIYRNHTRTDTPPPDKSTASLTRAELDKIIRDIVKQELRDRGDGA